MKRLPAILIVLLTLGFAVARFLVPVHGLNKGDIFKDLAHVYVGGLLGAAIVLLAILLGHLCATKKTTWIAWALAIGLTIVEVVAFFGRS